MKSPNWYVITGVPSSGKTTILNELQKKGYEVVGEAARSYIDQELKKGQTIQDVRKNELIFQKKVLQMKLEIESKTSRDNIVFFDRGIPDSMAYYFLCGIYYDTFLAKSIIASAYKKVFLFDPLPYIKDYARTEDQNAVKNLHTLLWQSYVRLGMPVVCVPVMTVEERLTFILSQLD